MLSIWLSAVDIILTGFFNDFDPFDGEKIVITRVMASHEFFGLSLASVSCEKGDFRFYATFRYLYLGI